MRGLLARWRRRSPAERRLLLEAFILLGLARLLILGVPFRWLASTLGTRMGESPSSTPPEAQEKARMIGQAVRAAARHTPWRSVCLPQATAGLWMLKRRRIPATLYLGVARSEAARERLAAHAWLRCGGQILTGAPEHRDFTMVASFS